MARSLNKVTLIGNVGNDPEIRATAGGTRVAKISIATNRSWTDGQGQRQEKTEWHRLTFFGRLVDIVEQYVSKGDRLYTEGRLEYSQTQDEQGNTRYWTDIVVQEMIMLGSQNDGGSGYAGGGAPSSMSGGSGGGAPSAGAPPTQPDDDLPF